MQMCQEPGVIIMLDDADAPLPSCGGCCERLRPWGYARARSIRGRGGRRLRLRPRGRRTAPTPVEVIGPALAASAHGAGHRRIAADLGLPAATVRGWLRRARCGAEPLRARSAALALELDPLLGPPAARSLTRWRPWTPPSPPPDTASARSPRFGRWPRPSRTNCSSPPPAADQQANAQAQHALSPATR
jgi:hypothetical protein